MATPYWQAIPANHTGATNGNYSSFKVCLGADGLARVGDAVPVTLPEEVKLHAMTVAWRGTDTTTNHKIRRVALVDSEGRVAAVSWNTQDVPLGASGTVMSTVFTFPEGTAVDTTQTYTGYFVDSAPLAVDEIFDTSRAITGSMGAFTGASEEGGFYLPELTTASPMMSFTLSTAEESVWQATLTGDVSAEDLEVVSSKGTTTKKFTELTDSDAVELTLETSRATLTLTDAQTLDSITVKGSGTLVIAGGKLTATQGVAVSLQSTLELREDTDWKITGPGKVVIPAGVEASLTCTENAYTGGTAVLGTLRWAGEGTLGTGEVVVQSGGVFDIGELACAQAITLAGGKLAGAFEREDSVFSVNFYSSQGAVGATEVAGLLPMLGEYWTQSSGVPEANTALTLVSESAMGTTGATTTSIANALSTTGATLYDDRKDKTHFLKGYLDDGARGVKYVSLNLPEEIASRGYDLYLYSNTDTANVAFAAREIVADGVSTFYTYVDGVLTTGSTAGWGNSDTGRSTIAEGVNVMVIPNLTSQSNTINLWHNVNDRGCLAALQGRVHNGGAYTVAYTGALKVTKPSQVEAASGKGIYLAGTTITGSSTLEVVGSGQVVASGVDFGERELGVSSGEVRFESGNTLDGVVVNVASGARAAVGDSVSSLTISGLKGEGVFDAGSATEIILTGGVGSGATFKGELASSAEGEAQTLIKRGAAKQVFASLAGFTASISVEGGTLEYDPASAQTVERLLLKGGTFSTQGAGAVSVAFTQMTSGNVTMAPAGTAQSARPAMETASAATVSNFTLATGGTVLYYSEADFAKYFPAGFIPQGDYTVRLSSDFADTLSFPYTFTILGAASGARFTVLDANGNEAPEGSWSASGGRITLIKEDAIVGSQGTLPAPRYHYTFDNENCAAADDAQVKTALSGGSPYVDSDNGKALHGGTPWISAGLSGEWTAGLYVRLEEMPAYSILFAIGRTNVSGALLLVRGEGNTLVLLRNVSGTLTEVCRATLPGNGQTWSHLALLHTVTAYRLYVNGELVATASGEFAETQEGFQIGTVYGGGSYSWDGTALTNWSASPASVDDCAVYNVALRGKLLKQAAGKLMARRRWHDAVLPADLFDPTATDWRDVEGGNGTWPGTGNAPETTTAEVELGGDATWEEAVAAITEKGFATRQAILSGASLTCTLSSLSTPVALPTGVASLTASNAVTLDLANVQAQVAARVLGGVEEVKVMEGSFTGEVSLANAPSGSAFSALSAEARDDGIYLVSPVAHTKIISVDNKWDGCNSSKFYGLSGYEVIGSLWNEIGPSSSGTTLSNLKRSDNRTLTGSAVKVTSNGSTSWSYRPGYEDTMLKGVAPGPMRYAFTGLPAGKYTVLLYVSHSTNYQASPVRILDASGTTYYTYIDGALTSSTTVPTTAWGKTNTDGYVEGGNTIKMPATVGEDGTLTVEISDSSNTTPDLGWKTTVGRGFTAGIQLSLEETFEVYTRTISGDGAWSEAGAWSLADGSVAPEAEPPAGAKVVLTMEGDATLTVSHADLKPDEILLFGSGDLTLRFDGSWLTDDFYGAIPRAGTTITLLDATHDTDRVKVWLDPLKYGAQAVMTRSGTQAQVTITLPEACYPAEGSDVPDLSRGKVVRAEVLGNATWENLAWTDGNGVAATAPTATDIAEIVLKADATLSATAATCATLRVYGEGHAVALSPRANFTVGTYAFFNDATLALKEAEGVQETLPTNCSILPKRVRYDYAYEGNLSTTAKYETEFAAGFTGAVTPAGGLVEFSGGTVTFSSVPNSGTSTAYVFSGDVQAVNNSGNFSVGEAQVYLRGNAQVSSDRLVLSDGGGGRASQMEIAGDATFTVTGSNNSGTNQNSLLIGHWTGTASITLRERGKLVAEQAEAALAHDATTTSVTIEDDAEMRVAGLAINRAGKDVSLVLNGGRLLVGKLGLVSHTGQVSRLVFNGGAIGAWQDVSLGSSVTTLFASVSGVPRFSSSGATLTLTTMDLFQDVGTGKVELLKGGLTLQGTSFTAFSHLALTNGTLTLAECSPTLDVLTLSGGTLGLEGAFPTVGVLRVPGNVEVRIPLEERLSDGGCLALTSGTALPDLSRAVFTLVLDPDRDESSRVIPEVPLVLGTYAEGAEAKIKGFALANNTNNAVSDYSAVLKVGTSGQGLYAELKGAEVLSEHTVSLTETAEGSGYTLIQSTVDAYPYHIFSGEASGARLLVPEGGVILPYAAFKGNAIRIVAGGSAPHTLLQGTGFTFSTDVTFDLGAWADKMPEFVRGAARGVPASICLVSGGVALVPSTVRLSVAFGSETAPTYTLPDGFTESIEVTADGVYYVVQSDRRVRTVSVDFTEDAYPLVAPPASIGAYALPAGAWNVLSGTAYAPRLQVSDLGGGLEGEAQDASGTVTQLQASSVLTEQDSSAPTALLKVWLDDTAAQRVRILNVPFEAYRVALVFAGGVSGAQYAVATVNGSTYAMDGEGYTRRDITSHKTSSSGVRVAGDTMWGTTETPDADAPVVLGENALVTDVLTDSTAEITLPVSSYGVYNAGLAAIQILEAPEATAIAEAQSFSYTFTASGTYKLEDLVLEGSGDKWENGSGNALTLTCDVDATLTLPAGFEADRVVVRGSGWLTLNVADNGGAALNILNAAQMANLTTDFPCAGVTFVPAEQVSRFEQIFDNNGLSYVISSGATLALGENSGITTNFDDVSSPILSINTESLGTLRRDYTVVQTSMLSYPKLTFAFRDGTNAQTTDNSSYNILVEAGDTINYVGKYHLQTTADTWSYTQTGGTLSCTSSADANYGFLLFNNASSASTAILTLTGGRMELSALRVYKAGCTADMSISGDAVLALGVGGFIPVNASDTLSLSFTEEGTLEATTATLGRGGSGTLSVVFNGGCLSTAMPTSTFTLPLTFSGSESEPTKIRAGVSTIVLSGTNSGSGHIAVESGTLAIANEAALGNAQVAVNDGTTFEVRELGAETISGAVTFADGSTCSVTTASDVTLPYTASIAGSVVFAGEQSAVTFLLNGEIYDGSKVTVDGGKVTFTSEAKVAFDAVEWGTDQASGIWQDGVAGPWKDSKTFRNGASVTFGANTVDAVNNSVKVSLQGRVAPASLAVTGTDRYTFLQGTEGAYLDASALGTALAMGSGQIYDVPIGIASPAGATVSGGYNSFRLLGMLSNDGKTASLLGSNNDATASGVHGVWRGADYSGDITLAPHAGETQILVAYGDQLAGAGNVIVTGGGTVQFAGYTSGTNWNKNFSGNLIVQDGSTLDFTMTREYSGGNGDESVYFCTDSSRATPTTKIIVKNGSTVRFSGCRGILGGWAQRQTSAFVQEQLLTLGKDCRMEYAYTSGGTNGQQYMPYSILLNGSGATLCAKDGAGTSQQEGVRGMYLARGATITVAGIGDAGDPADENTDENGVLTAGITAFIEADEGSGLVRWSNGLGSTSDTGVTFDVGEGSNLRILANLTSPTSASNANTTIFKTGNGRLSIEFASISVRVPVKVDAGTLGGSSALVHEDSVITLAAGTTIEAGLRVPKLFLAKNITLALDPTGSRLLRADRAIFTAGGAYTITSLVDDDEIPEAGEAPVKVMAWSSEQNVGTVTFTLDSAITAKGYGLEVGDDGLYLKRHITYIKELNFEVDEGNPPTTVNVAWFRDATWYRLDDTEKTLRNYDPDDNEAVTACFVLPEAYAGSSVLSTPAFYITLTQEASFSNVSFAVWETDTTSGDKVLKPLSANVVYTYDLTKETMPGEDEVLTFTWVPTLAVDLASGSTTSAQLKANVPSGYACMVRDATAVVYQAASQVALNLNFTDRASGDVAWISAEEVGGAVPFAGVYWNNISTANGGGQVTDGYSHYEGSGVVAGMTSDDGEAVSCAVHLACKAVSTITSRRGSGDAALSVSHIKGSRTQIPEAIRTEGGMTASGTSSGWQVRVESIPFEMYDLYILLAGDEDGTVTYPAVRIKAGSWDDWRTFSLVNGWTAPASTGETWSGTGSLVNGGFVAGRNLLHLRISATKGADLQIVPCDGGQNSDDLAAAVGLAALQIVQCEDGVELERLGTGKWSDASGWKRTTLSGEETLKWSDATTSEPWSAKIPTTSLLTLDTNASTPFLAFTGSTTMRLARSSGAISAGAMDLRGLSSGTVLTVQDDLFTQAPNVILAPGITLALPENDSGVTTNAWHWVYDDATRSGEASTTSTLQKTGSGDLTLTRKVLNKLQIDDGTLWLDPTKDGEYTRNTGATISGSGSLGCSATGSVNLTLYWSDIQNSGAEVLTRVKSGNLYLLANGTSSLPEGKIVRAEDNGTLVIKRPSGSSENRPFTNGTFSAINGGRVIIREATNLFRGSSAYTLGATVRLDSGTVQSETTNGQHHHVRGLVSRGNSTFHFSTPGQGAWSREGLILWDSRLLIEEGTLAAYAGSDTNLNSLVIRSDCVPEGFGYGEGSYIEVPSGSCFASDVPLHGNGNVQVLRKTGAGVWLQTRTVSCTDSDANNGGKGNASNITVHEGTLRLNLGSRKLENPTWASAKDREIRVASGARLDGAGEIKDKYSVIIETGGTLGSGLPPDWEPLPSSFPQRDGFPNRFTGEPSDSIGRILIDGNLTMQSGTSLEFNLANTKYLEVKGTTTLTGALAIRLTNLPDSFTSARKLAVFATAVGATSVTLTSPEAVALDAEVAFEEEDGKTCLYLKPAASAYAWENRSGAWSETQWTYQGSTVNFPREAWSLGVTPVARVRASSADVALKVDMGDRTESGKVWATDSLVLAVESGRTLTLEESLGTLPATIPDSLQLNEVQFYEAMWKTGAGTAVANVPLQCLGTGSAVTLHLASGTLRLTRPLLVQLTSGKRNVVPAGIEISSGATLAYALAPSEDAQKIAVGYDALTQELSGSLTGSGTLAIEGDKNAVTLSGSADNSLSYDVRSGAKLTISGAATSGTAGSTRSLTVAQGGALEANVERALGWSPWKIALTAAESSGGAVVRTTGNARVRGSITVTPATGATDATKATFGTSSAYLDGALAVSVPAGSTLEMGGSWQTPSDVSTGSLTKTGAGELDITGLWSSNVPITVSAGTLCVTSSGSVDVNNLNNGATTADWSVESGATLVLANAGRSGFNGGSITVKSGGTLDLTGASHTIVGGATFVGGSTLRMGSSNLLATTAFSGSAGVAVNGTVWLSLDNLDLEAFSVVSAGKASYTLLDFTDCTRSGSGTFRLGGSKATALAEAGWILRDSGDVVTLEAFGGGAGTYTWAGDDTTPTSDNWNSSFWVAPNATEKSAWQTEGTPAVALPDADPLSSATIPESARTLEWNLPAQTLSALRCDNSLGDYTLTAPASASSPTLTLSGTLLKTGTSNLTIKRPVAFDTKGALQLLGGTTTFTGALSKSIATQEGFDKPIFLANNAVMAFSGTSSYVLKGEFSGDDTGTLRFESTGTLTLGSALDGLSALDIRKGSAILSASSQVEVAPAITLGTATSSLTYRPGTITAGNNVSLRVNATSASAKQGIFVWGAGASSETASAPRLLVPDSVPDGVSAINVNEMRYEPTQGHLVLDPGNAVLPESVLLTLSSSSASESTALWLGSRTDAGATFTVGTLSGTAGIVGVEPVIATTGDSAWAKERTLTVALPAGLDLTARTFAGRFMGATTTSGATIRAGLTVGVADATVTDPFVLAGSSTDANLGTLTVGDNARVEVTGSWKGDAEVSATGGTLAGSGTVGDEGRTVNVPAGATLSASVWGKRTLSSGSISEETIPTTLQIAGKLTLEPGSQIKVLVRTNAKGGTDISCIEAANVTVPTTVDAENNEVCLDIVVDDESGAIASDKKILGWSELNGSGNVTGRVLNADGTERTDYVIRKKSDGLYLNRSNARFWMILL